MALSVPLTNDEIKINQLIYTKTFLQEILDEYSKKSWMNPKKYG